MQINDTGTHSNNFNQQQQISPDDYTEFLEWQKYMQYQNGAQNSTNTEMCPYCGSTDLLYETVQNNKSWSSIAMTFTVLGLICFFIFSGLITFILYVMPVLVISIIVIIVLTKSSGEADGKLRVTCKRCGKKVK